MLANGARLELFVFELIIYDMECLYCRSTVDSLNQFVPLFVLTEEAYYNLGPISKIMTYSKFLKLLKRIHSGVKYVCASIQVQ